MRPKARKLIQEAVQVAWDSLEGHPDRQMETWRYLIRLGLEQGEEDGHDYIEILRRYVNDPVIRRL